MKRALENSIDNVTGKWALITGTSSGFGIEFGALLEAPNVRTE